MLMEQFDKSLCISKQILQDHLNQNISSTIRLHGDGSDRSYFRIRSSDSKTKILMQLGKNDSDRLKKEKYDWVEISKTLKSQNILFPKIISTLPEQGAIIIEDCGDTTLQNFLDIQIDNKESIKQIYHQCAIILSKLLEIKPQKNSIWCKRSFDYNLLKKELDLFSRCFLTKFKLDENEKKELEKDYHKLCSYISLLPQVFVHRDFHSRNLMLQKDKLWLIDFQDARLGPASYDLVSLCFDSYIDEFSKEDRSTLLFSTINYFSKKNDKKIVDSIRNSWKPVLIQRVCKAIGSFCYLSEQKKKGDYLRYIPVALNILKSFQLADERWPFLSGRLIERMYNEYE